MGQLFLCLSSISKLAKLAACFLLIFPLSLLPSPYGTTEADRLKVSELGLVWGNGELPYFDNITSSSTENQQTAAQLLAGALTGQLSRLGQSHSNGEYQVHARCGNTTFGLNDVPAV